MESKSIKLRKDVGKRIRDIRVEYRLSQQEVATKLGISIPAISKIETGQTDANLSRLNQIADALKLDVTTLFTDEVITSNSVAPETTDANKRITVLDEEISTLQRKIIALYNELHERTKKNKSK